MSNLPENTSDQITNADASKENSSNLTAANQDIHDSPKDEAKMKQEDFTIDLPDVADIPGQEHVHVPKMNEFADTTISSDDEEGVGILDDEEDEDDELVSDDSSDVSAAEKKVLRTAAEDVITDDNTSLREASLDNRDDEGDPLNEGSSGTKISGKDLDVAGADEDDDDEEIGEEDEENNDYSLGGDDNDEPKTDEF